MPSTLWQQNVLAIHGFSSTPLTAQLTCHALGEVIVTDTESQLIDNFVSPCFIWIPLVSSPAPTPRCKRSRFPVLAHIGQGSVQTRIIEGEHRCPGGDVFDMGLRPVLLALKRWGGRKKETVFYTCSSCRRMIARKPALRLLHSQGSSRFSRHSGSNLVEYHQEMLKGQKA